MPNLKNIALSAYISNTYIFRRRKFKYAHNKYTKMPQCVMDWCSHIRDVWAGIPTEMPMFKCT